MLYYRAVKVENCRGVIVIIIIRENSEKWNRIEEDLYFFHAIIKVIIIFSVITLMFTWV